MKLAHDWWEIVKRAWSMRFIIGAAVLEAASIALPLIDPLVPNKWRIAFAVTAFLLIIAAAISRLIAQKDLAN